MNKPLTTKIRQTISTMRDMWARLRPYRAFVAFSTGKDSLAMAAMLYEAVYPERPPCLYVHHDLEFPSNLDYLDQLRSHGFETEVVSPFLSYFELTERGIGFITLRDAWCVPMLVGTGLLDEFDKAGVELRLVHQPELTSGPQHRFLRHVLAAFAEFEHDMIATRIAESRAYLKKHGRRLPGPAPFGYDTDPVTKQLVPNTCEARRVARSSDVPRAAKDRPGSPNASTTSVGEPNAGWQIGPARSPGQADGRPGR